MFGLGPLGMVIVGTIRVVLSGARLPSVASGVRDARNRLRCRHCGWSSLHLTHCQHCGRIKHPEV